LKVLYNSKNKFLFLEILYLPVKSVLGTKLVEKVRMQMIILLILLEI